jgi:opacity protein-like surface antigen
MKKTLLLAVSILALSSVSALADGPYVAADLGLAITHDSSTNFQAKDIEYDMGFGFDVAGGYSLKENFRAEGEIGYRSADVKDSGGTSLGVLSFMANGYYDATQFKLPVTPYVGLGLGLLHGKASGGGASLSDTTFGGQFMLGASYAIDKKISVNAGYKLQSSFGDFEDNGGKISYTSSNLLVGARFNF